MAKETDLTLIKEKTKRLANYDRLLKKKEIIKND
jgi:hypothetical protein